MRRASSDITAGTTGGSEAGGRRALAARIVETCTAQGIAADVRPDESLRAPSGGGLEALAGATRDGLEPRRPAALTRVTLDMASAPAEAASDLRIVGSIDKGGMGWVRMAEQRSIGRVVAVKTLLPGRRGPVPTQAILREARIAGRLEHPNIVPVHAIGWNDDEGPVLVMKHIEGASWQKLLGKPDHPAWSRVDGDPIERNLRVLMQVCVAVEFAHAQRVIHRDIKPANVMVGSFGEVYLLDWGVAVTADERQDRDVGGAERPIVGTPAYMAPEMVEPGGVIDERTDVYLLGASLHEVLTGLRRHVGAEIYDVLMAARLSEPAEYGPEVPEELGAICNRACHVDPAARFAGADALRAALADFLRHRGSVATARRAGEELAALVALVEGSGADPERALSVHRRFSACRFGFQQALAEWPENHGARSGLQAAIERMVAFELDADDPRSAALLMAELPEARPALTARVEEARREAEARERAEEELHRIRLESRIRGRNRGRSFLTLVDGVSASLFLLFAGSRVRASGGVVDPVVTLGILLAISLANAAFILLFRRLLLDNRHFGRLMIVDMCLWTLCAVSHLVGMLVGMSFYQTVAADCLIISTACVTLAAAFDRVFLPSAVTAVTATAIGVWKLDHALDVLAAAYLLNAIYFAWIVRPGGSEDDAPSLHSDGGAGRQAEPRRPAGARARKDRSGVNAGADERLS